jgi:cytoskeletal protein RodZ
MRLTAILGIWLLAWPCAGVARPTDAAAFSQSTPAQENPQSSSSPQNPDGQPSTDQQKTPDQSAAPPSRPVAASPVCPENAQPGSSVKPECKPAASQTTKTQKHPRTHKTAAAPTTAAKTGPHKKVVRDGGTTDPNVYLSPRLNQQQVSHQVESTNQLLGASEANLKKAMGRQLSAPQQETIEQIQSYVAQAKAAAHDGDVQRAYNLALKANLLSAELAGH